MQAKKICILAVIAALAGHAALCAREREIVTELQAQSESIAKITLTWNNGLPDAKQKALSVYRTLRPISSYADIAGTMPVATVAGTADRYTDIVSDYREYYYAVLATGGTLIVPSVNATVAGVRSLRPAQAEQPAPAAAEPKTYAEGELREFPLPYLEQYRQQARPRSTISVRIRESALALTDYPAPPKREQLAVYAFDCDLVAPESGDDYLLFETLRKNFAARRFDSAVEDLNRFLSSNRSPDVAARAFFYRGESQYFCGRFKEAVIDFLQVEQDFPVLTKKWISSSLDLYQPEG